MRQAPGRLRSRNGHDRPCRVGARICSRNRRCPRRSARCARRLLLSQADHPPQVILVTSALPREGKTTAAVNLAVTLAQLGDRTLLIDGDLRKPGVSRAFNMTDGKHAGLSSYLAGCQHLDLVTVPHPAISNLSRDSHGSAAAQSGRLAFLASLGRADRRIAQEVQIHRHRFAARSWPPPMR